MVAETVLSTASLEMLPTELLRYIGRYADWEARRSLSFVNLRFNRIFKDSLRTLKGISVRGGENVSFYLVDVEFDVAFRKHYKFTFWSTMRTNFEIVESRGEQSCSRSVSVGINAKNLVEALLGRLFATCTVHYIHMGLDTLIPMLRSYTGVVQTLAISNQPEAMEIAFELQPNTLTIFGSSRVQRETVTKIDLNKLPNLRVLTLYTSYCSIDQFLDSKITSFFAELPYWCLTIEHENTIIERFKSGTHNYTKVLIFLNPTSHHNLRAPNACHIENPKGQKAQISRSASCFHLIMQ